MAGRGEHGTSTEPVRNRCRCGHFPTTHMRVAAVPSGNGAGFHLEPSGPCSVCRDSICGAFTPSV